MLSVIVAAYNEQDYVRKAVKSICAQTHTDLEIILVDDGSKDDTGRIMDELANADNRIQVIHKPNGGLVSARQTGVAMATGEYLTFVDGDDWLEPNAYDEMLAQDNMADIILAGHMEDTGNICKNVLSGIQAGIYEAERLLSEFYPNMLLNQGKFFEWGIFPGVWNKIFKTEFVKPFINKVNREIVIGEDACITFPALLAAQRICVLDKCFYHYRKLPDSMVGEVPPIQRERRRFELFYRHVKEQFSEYREKYDALEDWQKYMLFAMVPRADQLYRGYEKLNYLYPFPQVRRGSNIVLYAAGTYGQRLYKYLKHSGFCNVVLWADKNFEELQKMGLPVESPDRIAEVDYDYIVLTLSFEGTRKAVEKQLKMLYPEEKVVTFDEELIFSEESRKAFCLI